MSSILDQGDSAGRRKHLGGLAQVFKHRHGTWRDFGQFLKREFGDASGTGRMAGTASSHSRMSCRHNAGGRHNTALVNALNHNKFSAVFNHERYSRQCLSYGTFDAGKNGGLVVHDLCVRAAAFLRSIGRGDPNELTRRDFEYDPSRELPSSPHHYGSSQDTDASGDVDMSEDVTITQEMFQPAPAGEEFDDDGFFEDEDVRDFLGLNEESVELHAAPSSSVSLSDIPESTDSAEQYKARVSSTKMRAATLGYLWNFADSPMQLKREFRRLREDASQHVLHLCGCGLSFKASDGSNVVGCCERTHLKLGSSEENGNHRTFHTMLSLAPVALYADQVAITHQAKDGDGIF